MPTARADCPPFHDPLEDAAGVEERGGTICGPVSFEPGVKGNAACFGGDAYIRYTNALFASASGSVSFWFKRSTSDISGGILQIGQLGQPDSLGLFYHSADQVCFEMRNHNGSYEQVCKDDVLAQGSFAHIVASWEDRGDVHCMKLFVNGLFVGYEFISGECLHCADWMDIAVAGVDPWYGYAEGCVDELCFFDWPLLDSEVYAEYVYSSNRFRYQPTGKPVSTGNVRIVGKSLFVGGQRFTVKGVGYSPTPIGWPGPGPAMYTDPCIIDRDVGLLRSMGTNTIRIWSHELLPERPLLFEALYNGGVNPIYVIMGFWVPMNGIDYADPATVAALEDEFRDYVLRYKEEPLVLAWAIGNENNWGYEPLSDWFALANRLAQVAYETEGSAYHPTMVVNGALVFLGDVDHGSDDQSLNYVDMWGVNEYFGYDGHCYFDYYDRISAKPLFITEYGTDTYDVLACAEDQDTQATWVAHQWMQIRDNCVGGTLMEYSDELWKAEECHPECDPPGCVPSPDTQEAGGYHTDTQPDRFANEEWWGVVSVEDTGGECDQVYPRKVYYTLQASWREVVPVVPDKVERAGVAVGAEAGPIP